MFADDTTLLSRGDCADHARAVADHDFVEAKIWFNENKLLLNEKKTKNWFAR